MQLTQEISTVGIKNDLKDLNYRLLNAFPSNWKHTITFLKHLEKFPKDLDMRITKTECVEVDESSRNNDHVAPSSQYN